MTMRPAILRTALAMLMLTATTIASIDGEAAREPVWFWFASCGGPAMTLEVTFDGALVHKSTFPICRAERTAAESQGAIGRFEFTWRPRRPITWSGYRDETDRTAANENLEIDIWEAGAEADTLILGVSVSTRDRILMSTLHMADPSRPQQSEIAKGLLVRTHPADK